jgi:hypothetical protein
LKRNSVASWQTVGDQKCYFRSKMEYRFALYLEFMKKQRIIVRWEHEPKTFWFEGIKRGCVSYKPDFAVYPDEEDPIEVHWYEVKGYMDKRSLTKIKRFRKYFPNDTLIVINAAWFRRNSKKLKGLVPGWA